MTADPALLQRIDRYLDAVPQTVARPEHIGPLTLFVNDGPGWKYYARPTPGTHRVTASDIRQAMARQAELGLPRTFEWVVDLVPGMARATRAAGLNVEQHPLMNLPLDRFVPTAMAPAVELRRVTSEDDVAAVQAAAGVAFGAPGTEAGPGGAAAVRQAAEKVPANMLRFVRDRLDRQLTVTFAAFAKGIPIAVGSHQPLEGATEIVGVGTTPAFRRRGLGTALTSLLVEDALARGVSTVFLSAGDDRIAKIYAKLGFERVGEAGAAEPSEAEG